MSPTYRSADVARVPEIDTCTAALPYDCAPATTAGRAEVDLWPCNGGSWQHWIFQQQANGTYVIVNQYANLCLDDYNWNTAPGATVDLWSCNYAAVQQFHF